METSQLIHTRFIMLPISNKDIVRVTPKDSGITYLVKVPTIRSKAMFRRNMTIALAEAKVKIVSTEMFFNCMRDGVKEFMDDKESESILSVIDMVESQDENINEECQEIYKKTVEVLKDSYVPFAKINADKEFSFEIQVLEAVKNFLFDAEGFELKRKNGVVPDEIIELIPELHRLEIGLKVISLMNVSKEQVKNLESQSLSTATPEDSTAEENHQTEVKAGN